jgi:hypothetical protein
MIKESQVAHAYSLKKKAIEYPVPTDDSKVKMMLRQLG